MGVTCKYQVPTWQWLAQSQDVDVVHDTSTLIKSTFLTVNMLDIANWLPAACARLCSSAPSEGLSRGCVLGMTNRALPAAYSNPSGRSLTVALTQVLRPSMESSEAVQTMCEPAGIGCRTARITASAVCLGNKHTVEPQRTDRHFGLPFSSPSPCVQ